MNRLFGNKLSSNDLAIISALSQRISEKSIEWYGSDAIVQKPKIDVRTWSYLFHYDIRFSNKLCPCLCVKIPRRPEMASLEKAINSKKMKQKAADKYEKLLVIENIYKDRTTQFCYIKPVDYIADFNAIVMEKLSCSSIKELLFHPRTVLGYGKAWEKIEQILVRVGQWLHLYHYQASEGAIVNLDVAILKKITNDTLEALDEAIGYQIINLPLKDKLSSLISKIELEKIKCLETTLHGDFNCSNVLVTGDNLVGALDTGHFRGVNYEDIGKFVTDPLVWKVHILTNGVFLRESQLQMLKSSFVKGYFGDEPMHENLLRFYCMIAIIQKWIYNEKRLVHRYKMPEFIHRLIRLQMRNHFTRILERYL